VFGRVALRLTQTDAEINRPMNTRRKAGEFTVRKAGQNKKLAVQFHPLPRLNTWSPVSSLTNEASWLGTLTLLYT